MKESITKFDLESAFKALDEIDIPTAGNVKANKPALTEIFSNKTKFDALMEEYYDVSDMTELGDAKEAREAEVAQAKLARIEKIVDLDAESPEDLLPSYVGKFIMQCPQCMTLFYKDPEDVEASEEDPSVVNVNEVCQHCGNEAGYTLIGKVGEATQDEMAEYTAEETVDVTSTDEEAADELPEETEEFSDEDLDLELDDLDLDIEEPAEEEETKAEESFNSNCGEQVLVEQLTEETELEVSADEFENLINSPEFKQPMSDTEARAMMDELEGDEAAVSEVTEAVELNKELLKYAVINPDGTYAGVPCTSEEEARELAAQKEGRIIIELGALKEGIFDKVKDKLDNITDKLKSREAKADWLLTNILNDYNSVQAHSDGQLVPDKNNQKFKSFVVIGFESRDTRGNLIKTAPDFDDTKNLTIGKNGVQEKDNYTAADNIAKGWSLGRGNGPAFIYLANSKNDPEAVFLCEYFMGELKNDQLDKYIKVVKNHLKGAKLMAKGGMDSDEDEATMPEEVPEYKGKYLKDNLAGVMNGVDELQEASLAGLISDSLVESYGNVAGFKLSECVYENDRLAVNGTIYFTSGNTRKTTYLFTEALITDDGKVSLRGVNEKLGADKQFILTGNADKNKTFITESFNRQ